MAATAKPSELRTKDTSTATTSEDPVFLIESGINEVQAPPPIQDPATADQGQHLEDIPRTENRPFEPSAPERAPKSKPLPLLQAHCWLVFFSIWGTLARLGFVAFTNYPRGVIGGGQSTASGVVWANFAGCVVIGFLIEDIRLFALERFEEKHKRGNVGGDNDIESSPSESEQSRNNKTTTEQEGPKVDKTTIPFYIGLSTGFCGSFTSFSSYMLQSFLYLSNTLPIYTHPEKGYSVLSFLAYICVTLALSVSGLQFGAHLATFLQPFLPSIPLRVMKFLEISAPILAIGAWVGSIIMAVLIERWRGVALFACIFSPLGALGRFWASKLLNPRIKRFPLGTFSVNIIGTAVLAGVISGQYGRRWSHVDGGVVGCQLLRGVGDGFCGCLTTVSTWVVEIRGLKSMLLAMLLAIKSHLLTCDRGSFISICPDNSYCGDGDDGTDTWELYVEPWRTGP